jgi:putative endonuclease
VQAASFYAQHPAMPAELAGAHVEVPSVLSFKIRHPERRRADGFLFLTIFRRAEVEGPCYSSPMVEHGGWVYIMSSHSRCLYVGVTSDLHGRVWEHKNGTYQGFSKKYRTHSLVYQELFDDIEQAIAREKQLKGWSRAKKIALIEKLNPGWEDLAPSFFNLGPSTQAQRGLME